MFNKVTLRTGAQIFAFILPFVAVLALAGYHTLQLKKAHFVTLPITGFDPRDPLRGHYIAFRYDWGDDGQQFDAALRQNTNISYCACIDAANKAVFLDCDTADKTPSCMAIFPVLYGRQPDSELTRFYVPDVLALPLETMLRQQVGQKFEIELSVLPDRRSIRPHRLLINGQDWKAALGVE